MIKCNKKVTVPQIWDKQKPTDVGGSHSRSSLYNLMELRSYLKENQN